jgi:DNA-binding transcriptional ArsR family regulator
VADPAVLKFVKPDRTEGRIALPEEDGATLVLGRSESCAVAFPWDQAMSRRHAQLQRIAGAWQVADLGSSRGTFLRWESTEARVTQATFLSDGDRLVLGRTELRYLDPRSATEESTRASDQLVRRADISELRLRILAELLRPQLLGRGGLASNREIADALYRSPDAIKKHLEVLYEAFGVQDEPQGKKRMLLAQLASEWGIVGRGDLEY